MRGDILVVHRWMFMKLTAFLVKMINNIWLWKNPCNPWRRGRSIIGGSTFHILMFCTCFYSSWTRIYEYVPPFLVRQLEADILTISRGNSILVLSCFFKVNKYISGCWPRWIFLWALANTFFVNIPIKLYYCQKR